jgi:hypothetical protein
MPTFKKVCIHCHQSFIPKRNPYQRYCHQSECQNARKLNWRKQKRVADSDYRENQRRVNQSWQKRHPDYWRTYRQRNPSYAKRNREQTRMRQRKCRLLSTDEQTVISSDASPLFAKSDALRVENRTNRLIQSGIYRLIPSFHAGFAKSDALLVEIAVVTGF